MPLAADSNWRSTPAFNAIYNSLNTCVGAVVNAFGHRQRTPFVILRHRIKSTWAMMPWAQYRHLSNDHPANPSTICFFGNFGEFRSICLAFPPDLFSNLPDANSPQADPDVPPFPTTHTFGPFPTKTKTQDNDTNSPDPDPDGDSAAVANNPKPPEQERHET